LKEASKVEGKPKGRKSFHRLGTNLENEKNHEKPSGKVGKAIRLSKRKVNASSKGPKGGRIRTTEGGGKFDC